jgi:hypothetical protein
MSIRRKATALALLPLLAAAMGCSVGDGTGSVKSSALFAHDCWGTPPCPAGAAGCTPALASVAEGAPYDMQPDFFGANPYRDTLTIHIQRGSDLTEVSDGLDVLIDDIVTIRQAIQNQTADAGGGGTGGSGTGGGTADGGAALGPSFSVSVPIGVHPPGSPEQLPPNLIANPPIVHMALYLQRSCHNQNTVLYSVGGSISFTALFDGDPQETSADQKLTNATFDVQFGDLGDVPVGDYVGDVPVGLQSRVQGNFRFYFESGQPAQPFPN